MLTLAGTRTTTSAVTFTQSFRLGKDDRVHPPGMYTLHTLEEVYEGAFEPVYLATSIDFEVREGARVTTRIVSPEVLANALRQDKEQLQAASDIQANAEKPLSVSVDDTLAEYGIMRAPVDVFHFAGYRYSNLADAVAAAKRAKLVS